MRTVTDGTLCRLARFDERRLRTEEKEVWGTAGGREENRFSRQGHKWIWRVKPKIIHTRTFSCADDHPIVYYTFDDNNKAMCEYCSTHFVYEPEEKTHSEEMQDELEPIPCPMHEDYDDQESNDDYVNKILKGSG